MVEQQYIFSNLNITVVNGQATIIMISFTREILIKHSFSVWEAFSPFEQLEEAEERKIIETASFMVCTVAS